MKRTIAMVLITIFCFSITAQADPLVDAVFVVTWENGTPVLPELPEAMEIMGISAMESVTGNGTIRAQITAHEGVIEELKKHLEFVGYVLR